MEDNKFVVDLGQLNLSKDDKTRINAAIQRAVAGELALSKLDQRLVLVPLHRFPGPIGIVARILDEKAFEKLANG